MKLTTILQEQTIDDEMETLAVLDSGLYRGISHVIEDTVKIPIRTDRRPRDSDMAGTILFNLAFEQLTGEADIRFRVAFCTTDYESANEYSWSHEAGGKGSLLEVNPLKSSKIAYQRNVSDSAPICDHLESGFAHGDENATYIVNLLNESDSTVPSRKAWNDALLQIDEAARPAMVERLTTVSNRWMRRYKVEPARKFEHPSTAALEVMIFNAPYYFGTPIASGDDESLDFDDD